MTELTSLNNDQCCGWGCPLTVKKSVFIYVKIVTCNLYKTPVKMFDGNTTPNISLLAMIGREGGREGERREGEMREGREGGREGMTVIHIILMAPQYL